jgi:hypothetical protein
MFHARRNIRGNKNENYTIFLFVFKNRFYNNMKFAENVAELFRNSKIRHVAKICHCGFTPVLDIESFGAFDSRHFFQLNANHR